MNNTTTTSYESYEVRLAALDRAINRLQGNPEVIPDEVVALAAKFEQYLTTE